jgi:hypothetical protein
MLYNLIIFVILIRLMAKISFFYIYNFIKFVSITYSILRLYKITYTSTGVFTVFLVPISKIELPSRFHNLTDEELDQTVKTRLENLPFGVRKWERVKYLMLIEPRYQSDQFYKMFLSYHIEILKLYMRWIFIFYPVIFLFILKLCTGEFFGGLLSDSSEPVALPRYLAIHQNKIVNVRPDCPFGGSDFQFLYEYYRIPMIYSVEHFPYLPISVFIILFMIFVCKFFSNIYFRRFCKFLFRYDHIREKFKYSIFIFLIVILFPAILFVLPSMTNPGPSYVSFNFFLFSFVNFFNFQLFYVLMLYFAFPLDRYFYVFSLSSRSGNLSEYTNFSNYQFKDLLDGAEFFLYFKRSVFVNVLMRFKSEQFLLRLILLITVVIFMTNVVRVHFDRKKNVN